MVVRLCNDDDDDDDDDQDHDDHDNHNDNRITLLTCLIALAEGYSATNGGHLPKKKLQNLRIILKLEYSRTSCKRLPKMSSLDGLLRR